MHELYVVGIPTFAVLIGILLNQRGLDKLEGRLDRMQTELSSRIDRVQADLTSRIDRVQADLSQFYRTLGEHDGKLDLLISERPKPKI